MKKNILQLMIWLIPISAWAQFNLTGKVISQIDQTPLSGAHIRIVNSSKSTISDENGQFNFEQLKAGDLQLIVSYIGFEKLQQTIHLSQDRVLTLALTENILMSDEIVVRASRITDKTPLTSSLITHEMLQNQTTANDLPYLLQETPSVVVSSDAGTGIGYTSLRIRGTDLTGINVTLNGVPVNDPESHSVYFVDLPDLAASIDNIQIQRGIGTSTNGSAAFGASLNMKTESPSVNPFASFQLTTGSFNTLKSSLSFGTGINAKGFSLQGRLSKITSDGYVDRANSQLKSFFLSGSWSSTKTHLKLIATSGAEKTYQAWYGIPKDSLTTNRTYNPAGEQLDNQGNIIGYYNKQTDNYQQDYYKFLFAHVFSTSLQLTGAAFLTNGKGYYEEWKNNRKLSAYGLENILIGDQLITQTNLVQQKWLDNTFKGVQANLQHQKGRFTTQTGFGVNRYVGDHYGIVSWAQYSSNGDNTRKWHENKGVKNEFMLYAKSTIRITDKLNGFADLQWRGINYDIKGMHDDFRDLTQDHDYSFLNPKAGFFYQLNDKNNLYASVSVTHREPTRTVFRDAAPDQKIFSEKLTDYEAGYQVSLETLQLNVNLFYMNYLNQFVLTGKINEVGEAIMTNVPHSYRFGFEGSFNFKATKQLRLSGNLCLSSNKIKDFTEFVDNWNYWDDPDNQPYQYENYRGKTDISYSPALTSAFKVELLPIKNFSASLNTNVVSRQYIDNSTNLSRSLDPYTVTNLQINYTLRQPVFEKLNLSLQLVNLFNHQYETNAWVYRYIYDNQQYTMDGYFPQAGIHAMFGLLIRL